MVSFRPRSLPRPVFGSVHRMHMEPIAHIATPFATKFGVPRQAGLAPSTPGRVVLAHGFRDPDIVRGLEGFSHIWLIWYFSANSHGSWHPTVRPPRLGGNQRLGVFATRSPFRPNPIGLSCVRLLSVDIDPDLGPVLDVSGADLVDGTPILDIKPYVAPDVHPEANFGFTDEHQPRQLAVVVPDELAAVVGPELLPALVQVLGLDPRPAYQHDPERSYGVVFAGMDVRFRVNDATLTVTEVLLP